MASNRSLEPVWSTDRLIIISVVLLNSQIFAAYGGNPIGVPFFQEIFFIALFIYSSQIIFGGNRGKLLDQYVYALVVGLTIWSALAAWFAFEQPIEHGVMEVRKIFAFLIYFPLVIAFRRGRTEVREVLDWVMWIGIVCGGISILFGVLEGINAGQYQSQFSQEKFSREGVGIHYATIAALLALHHFRVHGQLQMLPIFFLQAFSVAFVVQSRQLFAALLATSLLIMIRSWIIALVVVVMLVFAAQSVGPDSLKESLGITLPRFAEIFDLDALFESARMRTINQIMYVMGQPGTFFGNGGLSVFWNGGFIDLYDPNFVLADVGFFGTFFRFGWIGILILGSYFVVQIRLLIRVRKHDCFRLLGLIWFLLLIMWPVAAIIEYRGHIAGLIMACSVGASIELKRRAGHKFSIPSVRYTRKANVLNRMG